MKQYTTEWAKAYIKKHKNINAIIQDFDFVVYALTEIPIFDDNVFMATFSCDLDCLGKMSEHPNGWKNSLVTRSNG